MKLNGFKTQAKVCYFNGTQRTLRLKSETQVRSFTACLIRRIYALIPKFPLSLTPKLKNLLKTAGATMVGVLHPKS